jgi:hypothetical protein
MKYNDWMKILKGLVVVSIATTILVACGTRYNPSYKNPTVMPAGVSKLKKKQIKRDFTN